MFSLNLNDYFFLPCHQEEISLYQRLNLLFLETITISLFFLLAGCEDRDKNESQKIKTIYLEQGWTEDNQFREISYNLSQGSKLIPYAWFLSLETPDSEDLIRSNKVIASLRFLNAETSAAINPDNLPVGFVKDIDAHHEEWIGLTCAACHTGQVNYRNTHIRIDGGQSLGDFIGLLSLISDSFDSLLQNPVKLSRFAQNLYGENGVVSTSDLKAEIRIQKAKVDGIIRRNQTTTPSGFGRVDAFGSIGNEIFVDDMQNENNFRQSNAPVSYPALWDAPYLQRVQWTGNVENPLGRNIGEVLGVFGSVNLTDPEHLFETSVKVQNLVQLEDMLKSLASPVWPQDIFGSLDSERVAKGKILYETEEAGGYACVDCHTLPNSQGQYPLTPAEDNLFGKQFIKTFNIPLDQIGTDRHAAETLFTPFLIETGLMSNIFDSQPTLPLSIVQTAVVGLTLRQALNEIQPPLTDLQKAASSGFRVYAEGRAPDSDVAAYKARPLNGIWSTSPYLHNGSIRTLTELLNPPAERETGFWLGSRKFDPDNVGLYSEVGSDMQFFNTTLPANSASGHNYGTTLTAEKQLNLLEFLKSL